MNISTVVTYFVAFNTTNFCPRNKLTSLTYFHFDRIIIGSCEEIFLLQHLLCYYNLTLLPLLKTLLFTIFIKMIQAPCSECVNVSVQGVYVSGGRGNSGPSSQLASLEVECSSLKKQFNSFFAYLCAELFVYLFPFHFYVMLCFVFIFYRAFILNKFNSNNVHFLAS